VVLNCRLTVKIIGLQVELYKSLDVERGKRFSEILSLNVNC